MSKYQNILTKTALIPFINMSINRMYHSWLRGFDGESINSSAENDTRNDDIMKSSLDLINSRIQNSIDNDSESSLISLLTFALKIEEILPSNETNARDFLRAIIEDTNTDWHSSHGLTLNGRVWAMDTEIEINKNYFKPFYSAD